MVSKVASAVAAATAQPVSSSPRTDFASTLGKGPKGKVAGPAQSKPANSARAQRPERPAALAPRAEAIERSAAPDGAKLISQVQLAQARLDQILKLAESGRTFTPAELLAFQAHAYRASQELDLVSKVVEKGTSAVKQTLQTQL